MHCTNVLAMATTRKHWNYYWNMVLILIIHMEMEIRFFLSNFTGNKTQQASAVGKLVAEKAKTAGISSVVFDRGGYLYHGRVKALADGAREGGLLF